MKRILLFAATLLLVLSFAAPAKAAGTDISIGADIYNWGIYQDNYDFDDDTPDAVAEMYTSVNIYLFNSYTDNVSTTIRFDGWANDANKNGIDLDRAYITMKEFLNPNVTLNVGYLSWTWQLRPIFGAKAYNSIAPGNAKGAFILDVDVVGMDFVYDFGSNNALTLAWGKALEASAPGNNANDIDIFVARYDHKIENGDIFVAFVFVNDNFDAAVRVLPGDVWYLNFGVDYFLMEESLELYFEFAYQDGDVHDSNFEFGAFAFNLGAEYTFVDSEVVPYIGLEITYIQGVDGTTYGFINAAGNWNRTLIAESDFFGGLWNKNWTGSGMYTGGVADPMYRGGYTGIKLTAGMKQLMNDKITLDVILGFFSANGDMPAAGIDKGLGWEIDIIASYLYTEDVTFSLGFGYFDPNEDLGGSDPDAVMMAIFACNIRF